MLFVSGACALVYQTAWLREFRLIFGGATPATAAVLAVFMGGLGLGGAWFGRRAERAKNLLRLYAWIEIGAAVATALTPLLLDAVRALYVMTGGVLSMGPFGATLAQLVLSAVVMGPACVLLGGNLPPAVKWVETDADRQRGSLGLVYGANALGAVVGVLGSTFWALEHLGIRGTLWSAAVLNAVLGGIAWLVARREPEEIPAATHTTADRSPPLATRPSPVPGADEDGRRVTRFVYGAAGVTGFTFFLAEMVWFRMLTPLLGGSVYCFGLILAVVLFGIGVGGAVYRGLIATRPGWVNLGALALTSTAQAVAVAVPWALGDRLAVMSYHAQQLGSLGFPGLIGGWSLSVATMAFLPAVLAGVQFPLLVGLLGQGRHQVARQVGTAYAANTAGAIVGSVAGGFLLLPLLTAPGCWKLVVALTLLLGFGALMLWERPWHPATMLGTVVLGATAVACAFHATGPTAAWRHTPVGYGIIRALPSTPMELEEYFRINRRNIAREYEGRESSIAVMAADEGWALFSNGKADGSALSDSGTQVMLGLISAAQHPAPRSAIVIGLGTGTSAGWLAEVPGMERVDVVELEARVVDVARDFFGPVNRGVVGKTNVQIVVGDAREVLLAGKRLYDLVVSEPPNPYRAGVANLFTHEYYRAVQQRLAPGGIFSQWLQGYQLSVESVQVVYATLLSVFPHVETWVTQSDDLVFVCHGDVPSYPRERLQSRLAEPIFREALMRAWLGSHVDDFLSRHIAGTATARRMAAGAPAVNTDDRNVLEYGLARSQMSRTGFHFEELMTASVAAGDDAPPQLAPSIDRARLIEARLHMFAMEGDPVEMPQIEGEAGERAQAILAWARGQHAEVLSRWRGEAESPAAKLMLAISHGRVGTPEEAAPHLAALQPDWPADTQAAAAWVAFRHGAHDVAGDHIAEAIRLLRTEPWVRKVSLDGLIELSALLVAARPEEAERLLASWRTPLSVGQLRSSANIAWYRLALRLTIDRQLEVLDAIGPNYPWTREFLEFRLRALEAIGHPFAAPARRELATILRQEGRSLKEALGTWAKSPTTNRPMDSPPPVP